MGFGIRRSITCRMAHRRRSPTKVVQGGLGEPTGSRGRETRFTFGAFDDGAGYNIIVAPGLAPFGKTCQVNNGAGTVHYDPPTRTRAPRRTSRWCARTIRR